MDHHPAGLHLCPDLSDMLTENLGHFPNIPSTVPPQSTVTSPYHHHFEGHHCYIFCLFTSHLHRDSLSCSLSLFPSQTVIYASMPSDPPDQKTATITFSSYSNISLGVSFVAKQSFGPSLVCSAGLLSVQQWDNYIAQSSRCVLFCPFSSRLCAFISMYCLLCHSHCAVAWLSLSENVLLHPLRPTNYGLWLFPFCFTECGAVANRRAGRKANTIDCLSFAPNWAKWEWLLPEFTLLQCLHADPPERHSLPPRWKLL